MPDGAAHTSRELRTGDVMTELSRSEDKRLVLAAGRAHPELATEIAEELGTELLPMSAYDFANGEIYVRSGESVRGKDVFIIQSHPAPLNNHLMEQLIMIDSMKRASARRITVVSPFYPYARQDKKGRGREPISARLVADLYKTAGASRVMSVDLHTAQIQGFFDGPVDHLFAIPLLADYIRTRVEGEEVTVVSPDTGRVRVAEQWADRLGGVPLGFVHKSRDLTVPNKAESKTVVGDVEGRVCVLIDDMIDTGGTIAGAVQILKEAGDQLITSLHATVAELVGSADTGVTMNEDLDEVVSYWIGQIEKDEAEQDWFLKYYSKENNFDRNDLSMNDYWSLIMDIVAREETILSRGLSVDEFQAAMNGRGSIVDRIVSSMSLMIPKRWVEAMT